MTLWVNENTLNSEHKKQDIGSCLGSQYLRVWQQRVKASVQSEPKDAIRTGPREGRWHRRQGPIPCQESVHKHLIGEAWDGVQMGHFNWKVTEASLSFLDPKIHSL